MNQVNIIKGFITGLENCCILETFLSVDIYISYKALL